MPERKSSLEIVLILLDTLLENLFGSATKGVLDLEPLAPRPKTPHLITAVKPFEELKRLKPKGDFHHLKNNMEINSATFEYIAAHLNPWLTYHNAFLPPQ